MSSRKAFFTVGRYFFYRCQNCPLNFISRARNFYITFRLKNNTNGPIFGSLNPPKISDVIKWNNGCNLQGTTSSSAVYTSKMRKCATSLSRDNYVKQRNIALFSVRIQVASDDSKFFTCVLKSGATVPQSKKWGYRYPSYLRKLNAWTQFADYRTYGLSPFGGVG